MVFTFPKSSFLCRLRREGDPLRQPLEKLSEISESIHPLKANCSEFFSFPDLSSRALGNYLDRLFRSMTLDILDEASLSLIQVDLQGEIYEGISYHGNRYCLIEAFDLSHQLKAYCMAQCFTEQGLGYVMTASSLRFAIWVEVDAYLMTQRQLL